MNIDPSNESDLLKYVLRLADNGLINGQRLAEWCGHGPVLEQDIALTNIALDQIGQARMFYQYAADLYGKDSTEDDFAMRRDGFSFYNILMLELPNSDWGFTLVRQFLYDTYNFYLFEELSKSADQRIAEIAQKSFKEISYHAQYSAEWVIRLGDGTEESHERVQEALDNLWEYTGEMFAADSVDKAMQEAGIAPDLASIHKKWHQKTAEILQIASLKKPQDDWMQEGGKQGEHSESLGFILTELQFMQRAYPDARW